MSGLIREQALVSVYSINNFQENKLKNEIKTEREGRYKNSLTQMQNQMNDNEKSLSTITQEKGVSNSLLFKNGYSVCYKLQKGKFISI